MSLSPPPPAGWRGRMGLVAFILLLWRGFCLIIGRIWIVTIRDEVIEDARIDIRLFKRAFSHPMWEGKCNRFADICRGGDGRSPPGMLRSSLQSAQR